MCVTHAVTTCLANQLAQEGFTVLSLHPGFVHSDMGRAAGLGASRSAPGSGPTLSAEDSVQAMLQVLQQVTPKDSGRYIKYNGEAMPW